MERVPGLLPGLTAPPGLMVTAPVPVLPEPPRTPVPLTVTVEVPKAEPLVLLARRVPEVIVTPPEKVLELPVTFQTPVPSWTRPMALRPLVMVPERVPLPGPRRRRLRVPKPAAMVVTLAGM